MEIRTEGLLLRPPCAADLDAVVAACGDPEIPRFIPLVPVPYAVADAHAWLEAVARAWRESDERTFAIVADGAVDMLQGVVTVRLHAGGTVGYWLAPWARGQGVMTKAVRAVVRWAAEEQAVTHLVLTTHPDNVASQRVAERAGFVRVGTTDHEPPFRDGVTTAVLFALKGVVL
jgi:RimJ/RimL family protein N-acetyltransferase